MNAGQSVSRVGGAAQIPAMKAVSGTLRLELAQYRELAAFAQFGSDLDSATQKTLRRGEVLVEILKQPQYKPMDVSQQVTILYAATNGFLDTYNTSVLHRYEADLIDHMQANHGGLLNEIRSGGKLKGDLKDKLHSSIKEFDERFNA